MNQANALDLIEIQILQIESFLWENDFEAPFRIKRLVENDWELISWKPHIGRFRLTFTKIASFETSGGIPDIDVPLAEASDEIKLKIGPHLENFMMRYFQLARELKKQTKDIESFGEYLKTLREKIHESGEEIRRVANS